MTRFVILRHDFVKLCQGVAAAIAFGYIVAYVMAVWHRADDEAIGQCAVPLAVLMDQREHTLRLTLQAPATATETTITDSSSSSKHDKVKDAQPKTNASGGFGILRVKLQLSEN